MVSSSSLVAVLATFPLTLAQSQISSAIAPLISAASSLAAAPSSVRASVESQASSILASASAASVSSARASASASASAAAPAQTVAVGQNGLVFTPDSIVAPVGSRVTFQFYPKNHSVVQSTFSNPCNPLQNGIFSGYVAVANGTSNQTFTITVQNTDPIWMYCSQNLPRPHCAGGMVMVINPPTSGSNTLTAFRAAAVAQNQTAGEPTTGPTGGTVSNNTSGTGGSASPSASSSGARPSSSSAAAGSLRDGVSALGVLFAAGAAMFL